jgi:hypothetical protein
VFVLLGLWAVVMFVVMIRALPARSMVPDDVWFQTATQSAPVEYVVGQHFTGPEFDTAMSIISCESNFDPRAANPHSTARGLWQFLRGTWQWVQDDSGLVLDDWPDGPYDWYQSTAAAAWLRDAAGWTQWSCYRVNPRVWTEPVTVDLVSPGRPGRG